MKFIRKGLVSIIVPVYNVEAYIDECVESLTKQTYTYIEIILVDDGSTDDSPSHCDKWEKNDKRVSVIHKKNEGLSDARNTGIDASTGEFIMFVDSDDFIGETMVEELLDLQQQTSAEISCGGIYKFLRGNSYPIYNEIIQKETIVFAGYEQLKNLLNSHIDCSACGKIYKRSTIGTLRFIKGRYNEDVIFLFSLYASRPKVAYTCRRFYYYRDTVGSVTNQLSKKTMDALVNMQEMKHMVQTMNLPVSEAMDNYMLRTCLELAYSIQRANAKARFPEQSSFTKKHVRNNLSYMAHHPEYYNWRDWIHAFIILIKL